MDHGAATFLALFVVYVAAQIGQELAQRLRLPSVVGEIAAGVAIGPSALNWIPKSEMDLISVLAEVGAVILLFTVGLETRFGDIRKVGKVAVTVGVVGVFLPFFMGLGYAAGFGHSFSKSLFIAAAFVATSAGITARVLQQMNVLQRVESRIILGAAVIDDILAMLLLGVVTSISGSGTIDVKGLLLVLGQAILFVGAVAILGGRVMRRSTNALDAPINPLSPLTISIAICLGLAFLSAKLGLAAIIGAFLAGMVVAETEHQHTLEHQMKPIAELIVPFFFVFTGSQVDLSSLGQPSTLLAVLVMTIIAFISKFLAGKWSARSLGKVSSNIVGFGMVPRGEVGIIVASLGLRAGAFQSQLYSVIIAMSLLTAILTPPLLASQFRKLTAQRSDAEVGTGKNGSDDQT